MKLDQVPDNGYVFKEELEQYEKATERLKWVEEGFSLMAQSNERLIWMKEGVNLYNNLTKRERQVAVRIITLNKTQREIAEELKISQPRVSNILKGIYTKAKLREGL